MADSEPAPRAPTSVASAGDDAILLKLTYDPTGLASVAIFETPIVSWIYDELNPQNGATPVAFSALPPVPPNTAPIVSPQWAVGHRINGGVFAAGDVFVGTFHEFLTWLGTNNGASRTVTGQFGTPALINSWNLWCTTERVSGR